MGSTEVLNKNFFGPPTKFATKLNLSNKVLSLKQDFAASEKASSMLETTNDKGYFDEIQNSTNDLNEEVDIAKRLYQDPE